MNRNGRVKLRAERAKQKIKEKRNFSPRADKKKPTAEKRQQEEELWFYLHSHFITLGCDSKFNTAGAAQNEERESRINLWQEEKET